MNKRIKELFKRAGGKTSTRNLMSNPVQVVEIHEIWDDRIEKFAELIVGECLDIVANSDMTELEGPDPEDVLYVACKQIKEHFGVEE